MKTITLIFDEATPSLKVQSDSPLTFQEFTEIALNGVLSFANTILEQVPEESQMDAKKELYDLINISAANLLTALAPEIEARPTLTEDAILAAENAIIDSTSVEDLHAKYD